MIARRIIAGFVGLTMNDSSGHALANDVVSMEAPPPQQASPSLRSGTKHARQLASVIDEDQVDQWVGQWLDRACPPPIKRNRANSEIEADSPLSPWQGSKTFIGQALTMPARLAQHLQSPPGQDDRSPNRSAQNLSVKTTHQGPTSAALILPHGPLSVVGRLAARAWHQLRQRGMCFDVIVLMGPRSKALQGVNVYWDKAIPFWDDPLHPQRPFAIDPSAQALARALNEPEAASTPLHWNETVLESPLPFIAHLFPGTPLVPILINDVHHATRLARRLGDILGGQRVLYIALTRLGQFANALNIHARDAHTLHLLQDGHISNVPSLVLAAPDGTGMQDGEMSAPHLPATQAEPAAKKNKTGIAHAQTPQYLHATDRPQKRTSDTKRPRTLPLQIKDLAKGITYLDGSAGVWTCLWLCQHLGLGRMHLVGYEQVVDPAAGSTMNIQGIAALISQP